MTTLLIVLLVVILLGGGGWDTLVGARNTRSSITSHGGRSRSR